jgi:hypothetical protein
MHYEYAVDPRVMGSSWQMFRYLIEKFGFDRGRLISEFPRKAWFREVYEASNAFSPTQKARLEIMLKAARGTKVIRSGRPYDDIIAWLPNALTEHRRAPFRAVIASENSNASNFVLVADEMEEEHPLMLAPSTVATPRDPVSIATALRALIIYGSSILIVDPFFDPTKQRYKEFLREFLRVVKENNSTVVCEIHYRSHPNALTPEDIERHAKNVFPGVIADGMTIKFYCWKEKDGGADFHARYLLTDKGGIGVDAGFSAEGRHQTTDMHRMELASCQERVAAFERTATIYELVEPVLLITSTGQVTHA